jgi:type IV pilus assembly protein PilC
VQALGIAASSCTDTRLAPAVANVTRRVERGEPLASALGAHPEAFEEIEVALVAVGQETGLLDPNLARLADRAEETHHRVQKFLFALAYPVLLFVAALFLPRLYVWFTSGLAAYLASVFRTALPFLLVLGLLGGAFVLFRRSSPEAYDRVQLQLPFLGPNLRKLALARFSDSLAMLYAGGVELRRSLALSARATGNRWLERRCASIARALDQGGTLADGFLAAGVFPREVVGAVRVGEVTGDLEQTLASLARLQRQEAERAITALLVMLPIAIYLLVALYIAIVVISAWGAYFKTLNAI